MLRDVHFEGLNSDLIGEEELQRLEDLQRESAFDECISVTIPPERTQLARSFDNQRRVDGPAATIGEHLLRCRSRVDSEETETKPDQEQEQHRSGGLADFLNVPENDDVVENDEADRHGQGGQ